MKTWRIYFWMGGICLLLTALVLIQLRWLRQVRLLEGQETDRHITAALDRTARQLERSIHCYEGYSKVFINTGECLVLLHESMDTLHHRRRTDTLTLVYNPSGLYPDTMIIRDKRIKNKWPTMSEVQLRFHIPFSDTEQRNLQAASIMDTVRPKTYRDVILNKLSIGSLLNTGRVDSLLRRNLELEHIRAAQFGYGFIEASGRHVAFAKRIDDTVTFLRTSYSVTLFADNQFLPPYRLAMELTGQAATGSFQGWLLLSMLIILLLALGFLLFVRRYLRQRRLSEMKSDFINNLTHELNTPMANIALAVETINGSIKDERTNRILDIISSESYRLRENIERTLQIATLEKGQLQLQLSRVDLVPLINTILSGYQTQCAQLGGIITFAHPPEAIVKADEVHLLNCICNLLDNAIKYRKAAPHIELRIREKGSETGLEVIDNGIGMDAETQHHIFEQFYRAHEGDRHDTKGFGLGLSYVKGIVKQLGGRITVRSKPGEGSSFTIYLSKNNHDSH